MNRSERGLYDFKSYPDLQYSAYKNIKLYIKAKKSRIVAKREKTRLSKKAKKEEIRLSKEQAKADVLAEKENARLFKKAKKEEIRLSKEQAKANRLAQKEKAKSSKELQVISSWKYIVHNFINLIVFLGCIFINIIPIIYKKWIFLIATSFIIKGVFSRVYESLMQKSSNKVINIIRPLCVGICYLFIFFQICIYLSSFIEEQIDPLSCVIVYISTFYMLIYINKIIYEMKYCNSVINRVCNRLYVLNISLVCVLLSTVESVEFIVCAIIINVSLLFNFRNPSLKIDKFIYAILWLDAICNICLISVV